MMKKLSLPSTPVLIMLVFLSGCGQQKAGRNEDLFLGKWYAVKGDIDEYSFMKDNESYIFTAMAQMNPVIYGKWKTDGNKFIMTTDNGAASTFIYSLANDTLILNEGEGIYTRTVPLEIQFPEAGILKEITSELELNFSKPRMNKINWIIREDSTGTSGSLSLNGFSISLATTISSGDYNKILKYISDSGFDPDSANINKSGTGFTDDELVVTVQANPLSSANSDSITIQVSSGIIK